MKRKLLFAAFALLLGVSNAMAREDVTSTYLTDADLADEATNWALVNGGNNHNWNGTYKYHESWHNTFTISQTVTLPNGYYEISIQAASQTTPSTTANLTATSGETSVVSPIKGTIESWNFDKIAELFNGDNEAQRIYATVRVQNGSLTIKFQQTSAEQWVVYGNVKLVSLTEAEYQNAIAIQAFKETNTSGWRSWTNGGNNYGFGRERFNETAYTAGKVLYQTITGLPSGKYDVVMHAKANKAWREVETGDDIAQIYANNKTYGIPVEDKTGYEATATYKYTLEDVIVTDGNLELGIQNIATGGNWYVVSLYNITYKGEDLSDYETPLAEAKTAANGVDQEAAMNATVLNNLQSAISTYGSREFSSFTTVSEIIGAINALNNATTAANNSIDNYTEALVVINAASSLSSAGQTIYANNETISAIQSAYTNRTLEALTDDQKTASSAALAAVEAWFELKDYADALVAVENTNAEANATLASAILTQNTAATGATTTAAVTTATSTLKTAMITYAGAADPTSGNRFDLTFMLTNPDLTDFASWNPAAGWYTEMDGGNSQVMHNEDAASANGDAFYEYWSESPAANGNFTLYQKVTLPEGTYTMTCDAFSSQAIGGDNCAVYFYANDTQGSLVSNYPMAEKEISFINESEQEVKIGLKALTGNTYRWMGIGYVKLYKEYTDNTTYDITTTISNASVAVTVDGDPASSAKALKTVTLTVSDITDGYVISGVTATYNDGGVKNLDVANPSANVYTFQMPAYAVTATITTVVDKRDLASAINAATAARKQSSEGAAVFQIPVAAGTSLASAIATAQGVYNNPSATVSEVSAAVTAMNSAQTTYEAAHNAPVEGKPYIVANKTASGALKIATTSVTVGSDAFVYFTAVDGGYVLSNERNEYILKTSDNNWTLSTTETKGDAYIVTIIPVDGGFTIHGEKGLFGTDNTDAGSSVYANMAQNQEKNTEWCIYDAPSMKVTAGKWGTFIAPFEVNIPEGVEAYTVTGVSGTNVNMSDAIDTTIPANTPVLLWNNSGENLNNFIYGVSTVATENSYTVGLLTGVYASMAVPTGSYVLQTLNEKQAFYIVDAEDPITVPVNRAYLTVSSGGDVKAFFFDLGEADAIRSIDNGELTMDNAEIFNLAGQKMSKLQRGVNIVNGKKVFVK